MVPPESAFCDVGFALILKSGACETFKLTCVECVVPPPAAMIVRVIVPGDTLDVVEMVRVEEYGGVPEAGLKDPDTPAGAPPRLRATL